MITHSNTLGTFSAKIDILRLAMLKQKKAVGPPIPTQIPKWEEVVLDGAQALDRHGLALHHSHDHCAAVVDHKSVGPNFLTITV